MNRQLCLLTEKTHRQPTDIDNRGPETKKIYFITNINDLTAMLHYERSPAKRILWKHFSIKFS